MRRMIAAVLLMSGLPAIGPAVAAEPLYVARDAQWVYYLQDNGAGHARRTPEGLVEGTYEQVGAGANRWIKAVWGITADCSTGWIRKDPERVWRASFPGTAMESMVRALCSAGPAGAKDPPMR